METNHISLPELIKDEYFITEVKNGISELRSQRLKRKDPKPGYYYKRDWYDRMIEYGHLNHHFFIENIIDIWERKSQLSSQIRRVIEFVCTNAAKVTIEYYNSLVEKSE